MRVYYLTGANFAVSNIALRRIKVSRFGDLNDPFELLGADRSNKKHRKELRRFRNRTNDSKGLICFSRSWRNPVLWGHYAEKHAGVCLGFDVPTNSLHEVNYTESPGKLVEDVDSTDSVLGKEKLLCTKFHDWAYEDELRLIVTLDHTVEEGGLFFLPFSARLKLVSTLTRIGPTYAHLKLTHLC
jgi:hypothetical protein